MERNLIANNMRYHIFPSDYNEFAFSYPSYGPDLVFDPKVHEMEDHIKKM